MIFFCATELFADYRQTLLLEGRIFQKTNFKIFWSPRLTHNCLERHVILGYFFNCLQAQQALHSTVSIVSDFLYEKLQDQLVNVADELVFGVTQEAMKQKEEEEYNFIDIC